MTEAKISTKNDDLKKYLESIGGYALLGWLIGTFVPLAGGAAMYLADTSTSAPAASSGDYDLTGIFVIIVVLCSGTGAVCGAAIGGLMIFIRRIHWVAPVITAPVFGAIWGIATGGIGGFPLFVVGGIVGAIVAAPFGIIGFLIFALVYETLVRKNAGAAGWRKTLAAACSALLLTMTGGAVTLLIYGK